MSQKLVMYFLEQGNSSRVLDAAHQPVHISKLSDKGAQASFKGWTVGRLPTCDIAFSPARKPDYAMVSKRHAVVVATPNQDTTEGGTAIYDWTVTDCGDKGGGSTNGTYLAQGNASFYRLQPGVPYAIREGDRIQFGCKAAAARLSFDLDETMGTDDDPPTGAKPVPVDAAEASGRTLADVAVVILNGPEGIDKRLWWLMLAAGALGYIYWVNN